MIQQQTGKAGDTVREELSPGWERILLLAEVYQSLPPASLVILLQERGFDSVEVLEGLPFFYLVSLAIHSHGNLTFGNKQQEPLRRKGGQGLRSVMLDLPI